MWTDIKQTSGIKLSADVNHRALEQWGRWKNTGTSQQHTPRVVQVLPEKARPLQPANQSVLLSRISPSIGISFTLFSPFSFLLLWHSWGVWCHSDFLGVSLHTHTHTILLSKTVSCELGGFLGHQLVKVWFLKPEEASLVFLNTLAFPIDCSLRYSHWVLDVSKPYIRYI